MNRIIKFRCWNKKEKKMYLDITDLAYTNASNGFELMQFTGLKDRLGKEIYEGDIIEWKYLNIWQRNEVKYIGDCFMAMMSAFKDDLNELQGMSLISKLDCEVIGNIYENPELLTNK